MCLKQSNHRRCSVKKVFLEISENSQENTCARVSFFNKVAGLHLVTTASLRPSHQTFTCSKRTLEKLKNGGKHVQS